MRNVFMSICAVLLCMVGLGQNLTSSNLPIIIITTDINPSTGTYYSIPDEPKIHAHMKVLYVNDTTINYLSNQDDSAYVNYDGDIGIELRGSTSQGHNKKPYGFETRNADGTNNNVSLLGLPAENDWVLNAMNDEPSCVRDCLSYQLYSELGHYSPRTRYCEVIVNDDYRGLYFLTEKIKIDANRVDIIEMTDTDVAGVNVTGGYIIKADKLTGGDVPAWTTPAYDYWEDVSYIYHEPAPDLISPMQGVYIQLYFDSVAQAVAAHNHDVSHGFPSLIDIPSFIDYMLMGELSSNVDIYQKSTFFHKERLGKLRAGPIWDFNLAYGYDFGSVGRSRADLLQFYNGDNTGSEFWHQLYEDPMYSCMLYSRWKELTNEHAPLHIDHLFHLMDSLMSRCYEARLRDRTRWSQTYDYNNHINTMKAWLQSRYQWLSREFEVNYDCEPELPPLVISKINYHPAITQGYASDELEFIGITNNGDDTLDISGVYFRELGLIYTFPEGSVILPRQEIFIASNPQAFQQIYLHTAFGTFLRHLDNHSETLKLADAWGRVIDEVTYADNQPWPLTADGMGDFLILKDLDSDNNMGENWMAANEFVGIPPYEPLTVVRVMPNPTNGLIRVMSEKPLREVCLSDISGRALISASVSDFAISLDLSSFPTGIYLLRTVTEDHNVSVTKLVKK